MNDQWVTCSLSPVYRLHSDFTSSSRQVFGTLNARPSGTSAMCSYLPHLPRYGSQGGLAPSRLAQELWQAGGRGRWRGTCSKREVRRKSKRILEGRLTVELKVKWLERKPAADLFQVLFLALVCHPSKLWLPAFPSIKPRNQWWLPPPTTSFQEPCFLGPLRTGS